MSCIQLFCSSSSHLIAPTFQAEVFDLWNALADYSAARTGDALAHFFDESLRLLDADGARWCLSVRLATGGMAERDLCLGWRVRDIVVADADAEVIAHVRHFLSEGEKQNPVHLGLTTINILRASGTFRVHRLHDGELLDFEAFRRSEHYRLYYEPLGLADRMWICCPINADVESGFVFDRHEHACKGHFSAEDATRGEFLLRGLGWFHRRLLLSRGIVASRVPCTPTQRETLSLLLTGKSEKEIAEGLGLNPKTTHNRITALFRNFGVSSRAELMALWL